MGNKLWQKLTELANQQLFFSHITLKDVEIIGKQLIPGSQKVPLGFLFAK
jgi:hypothetical protein